MGRVVIGMDPHKRSATIEVLNEREQILATGRFGTDRQGYRQLLAVGRGYRDRYGRSRAAKGSVATSRSAWSPTASRWWTCLRSCRRGRGCSPPGRADSSDATDAHSIALVALRTDGLRHVGVDDEMVALRLLADHRDEIGAARTVTVNRLHRLLLELLPGGAKKDLTAAQARELLATVRPRDLVGKTRRQLAAQLVTDLEGIDRGKKAANRQLTELVQATGSTLMDLNGIGPSGAARLLGDIGDVSRFPTSTTSRRGTAPPRWTRPPATRPGTVCPGPGTGGSTGPCTSWPSSSCDTRPPAGSTTTGKSPPGRHR